MEIRFAFKLQDQVPPQKYTDRITMIDFEAIFSPQIFFIILRETIEAAIIVSVLLSFIKQNSYSAGGELTIDRKQYDSMRMQVWTGAFSGVSICAIIGAIFITLFYFIGTDLWSYTERIWEGMFSILSSVIIAIMGVSLLRINAMKNKWKASLVSSMQQHHHHHHHHHHQGNEDEVVIADMQKQNLKDKYFLFFLPFITTLREGLEAVVFVGGIGVNQPVSSFPLAIAAGAILGVTIGCILYSGGNRMSIQYFLIASTCFLYLVAAGLMSRGVWFFELERFVQKVGQDTSETGSGPGSYDVANTIWHVNCCNGLTDGGWMIFNALLGWTNTATYGSVISYIGFWLFIILLLKSRTVFEREGYVRFIPLKWQLKKIKKRIIVDEMLAQELEELELSQVPPIANTGTSDGDRAPLLQ